MREPVILPNVSGALLPQPEPKALAVHSLWRFGFFVFGQGGRKQGFAPHVHRVTISGNGLNIHGIVLILLAPKRACISNRPTALPEAV